MLPLLRRRWSRPLWRMARRAACSVRSDRSALPRCRKNSARTARTRRIAASDPTTIHAPSFMASIVGSMSKVSSSRRCRAESRAVKCPLPTAIHAVPGAKLGVRAQAAMRDRYRARFQSGDAAHASRTARSRVTADGRSAVTAHLMCRSAHCKASCAQAAARLGWPLMSCSRCSCTNAASARARSSTASPSPLTACCPTSRHCSAGRRSTTIGSWFAGLTPGNLRQHIRLFPYGPRASLANQEPLAAL